ncbi:DUF4233 domain-containing protein [Micromonospora parathelypteridis]|uniref:DUF4233 domain-containing protein n=1 Tax=Micromonospora parathelypteridis TaxID=1839617 RepID=A0A840VVM1_9ACTN|nr:DUF4233 domain-containing protein [Micromonospora parathelypteridis]MBB5477048.1 hypothetical protein [Micromonospora parathelypteridis]GGO18255.1 hypothetical protein GCM10011576_33090 [Micromonospora parathelypteridis]
MTGPERDPRATEESTGSPVDQGSAGSPADQPTGEEPAAGQPRPSGLRNPERAVRGLGAGTLSLEALVLLLAIQPIRVVGGDLSGAAIGAVVALAVAAVVLAGMMRRPWAWHAGTVLQGLLMLGGLLHWSLLGLGIIFALVWAYALHVRRVILG